MILQRLKTETAAQHHRLEQRLGLPTSISTMSAYRQIVADFWGMYQPLESALFAHAAWQELDASWLDRRKIPSLIADLTTLGMTTDHIEQLPQCTFVPELPTFAHVLGCMYVTEGSTLGGNVIARHLQTVLPITPDHGCVFFSSYGAALGNQWRAFCALLTDYANKHACETTMVEAAQATFSAFDRWFTQQGYRND